MPTATDQATSSVGTATATTGSRAASAASSPTSMPRCSRTRRLTPPIAAKTEPLTRMVRGHPTGTPSSRRVTKPSRIVLNTMAVTLNRNSTLVDPSVVRSAPCPAARTTTRPGRDR